ncbi:uncharacterized protein Triagg1_10706 [Trichoderma aggressivum f. europaeum]|uniref:Uncharacterized protein n=1 Tax=Trichoderma aggressivum f. europaeum TaxID=173218 RepID=A0AAE1LUY0_9HYPO|nr:hypothetical protein Triagg1_10706 [Trichoderma aggressivum f. europaeum]
MAGVVPGGVSTSTSISILPSQDANPGPDPNPNNGPGIGGGPGGSGSTANGSPTPTSSVDILPPQVSPTSSLDALPSPTVIVFNDAANFGNEPAGRVFFTSSQTKAFSWRIGNSTTTPLDISWYGMPFASGQPFDISQAKVITRAKFGGSRPGTEIVSLSTSNATLNLTSSALLSGDWYKKDMVIKIDWKTKNGNLGFTQSGVFTVANSTTSIDADLFGEREATDNDQDRRGGEAVTSSVSNPTLPTSGPSDGNGNGIGGSSSGDSSGGGGGGGGGLSTGAIAGIAVACSVVGILLIGGLVWFLLRRRRRRHFDQGYNATGQTTNSFIATKEVQASVAESPIISPFSDDGTRTGSTNAMLPLQTTIAGTLAGGRAPTHDDEVDRPGSSASDNNNNNNRSRNIAHLVEEGMTEADILRLEEEERHLDAEIERAARRTST